MPDNDVLFEFVRVGHQMRVAAVHAGTGTEVVVIAPLTASQAYMQQLALAKLRKKMAEPASTGPARLF